MSKFFVDTQGNYIGSFDGAEPPEGSIEVPSAPADARDTWDFTPPGQWISYVPPPTYCITTRAFRSRFTVAEKVAIDMASIDDPSASPEARQQAAQVRVALSDLAASAIFIRARPYFDMARPDTQPPVLLFEALGILAAGRANEILNTPVPHEDVPPYIDNSGARMGGLELA